MPVFRWGDAWGTLKDFEQEMDRLLQSIQFSVRGTRAGRPFPAVNLYELEEEYLITAEIPGVNGEDLDLSIAGGVLTLRGKRGSDPEISEEQYRRRERIHGTWERALALPERVDDEGLTAELKEGLLKIHLPKIKQSTSRQIPVITS
jgi:HSP20 family protein